VEDPMSDSTVHFNVRPIIFERRLSGLSIAATLPDVPSGPNLAVSVVYFRSRSWLSSRRPCIQRGEALKRGLCGRDA
jgi:hypothetical protein